MGGSPVLNSWDWAEGNLVGGSPDAVIPAMDGWRWGNITKTTVLIWGISQ